MAQKKTPGQENPFDLMSNFDVSKMLADLKVPTLDVQGVMESHRKNLEVLAAANKVAMEGAQTLAKRQAEMLREAVETMTAAAKDLGQVKDPQQFGDKQVQLTKDAYERGLKNLQELAALVSKSNEDAFKLLNQRINEVVAELQALAEKSKG